MSTKGRRSEYVQARDGLVARNSGVWAKEKLSFIDEFGPAALKATARKSERWYVDLFAGPGVNIDDEETGEEFEGAALRALKMTARNDQRLYFTNMVLVNKDEKAHKALLSRVDSQCESGSCRADRTRVEVLLGDANRLVHNIMRRVPQSAYLFVFADIEAPRQLPFSTVRALRAHGHESLDFFVLFPLDMAINRIMSFNPETVESSSETLTTFFGTEDWRPIVEKRITEAQSADLRRSVLDLYMNQLRKDWRYINVVRDVRRIGDAGLYKMLFATNHLAGKRISDWSATQPSRRGQLELF